MHTYASVVYVSLRLLDVLNSFVNDLVVCDLPTSKNVLLIFNPLFPKWPFLLYWELIFALFFSLFCINLCMNWYCPFWPPLISIPFHFIFLYPIFNHTILHQIILHVNRKRFIIFLSFIFQKNNILAVFIFTKWDQKGALNQIKYWSHEILTSQFSLLQFPANNMVLFFLSRLSLTHSSFQFIVQIKIKLLISIFLVK